MLVPSAWLPYLAAAALMLGLGIALVALDAGSRANRVFAAFLFFRALWMGLSPYRVSTTSPDVADFILRVQPYVMLPVVPLLVLFAASYPRPRTVFGRRTTGPLLVLAFIAGIELWYALDHAALWSYAPGSGAAGLYASAAPGAGLVYTGFGPLIVLVAAQQLTAALLAFPFAVYAVGAHGSRRTSALLIAAGLTLNALFDGTNLLVASGNLLAQGEAFPWWPWGWAFVLLPALTIVPAAGVLVYVAQKARTGDAGLRAAATRLLVASALPVLSAVLLATAGSEATYLSVPLGGLVVGVWRLALPVLATYALLRHQLFDIDVKVRLTIKAGTVGAVFLIVFFTASELAANLIQERVGTAVGVGAAVAMAFALRPIERHAETLAHRIVPNALAPEDVRADERAQFYAEQAALAWQDGELREKERAMLDRLRARLGLSADEAARLDAQVSREARAAAA